MEKALSKRTRDLEEPNETVAVEAVSEAVLEGVREALLGGETHYTDRPGMKALRERIAERLDREPDAIVVTAGEKEARYVIELAGVDAPVEDIGTAITSPEPIADIDTSAVVLGTFDGLDELRSFRLAFLAAPSGLGPKLKSWKQALSICTAAPSQRAALLAWKTK